MGPKLYLSDSLSLRCLAVSAAARPAASSSEAALRRASSSGLGAPLSRSGQSPSFA